MASGLQRSLCCNSRGVNQGTSLLDGKDRQSSVGRSVGRSASLPLSAAGMLYRNRSDGLRFSVDFTLLCSHCERGCYALKRDKERSEAKRMEGRHHEFSG